MTCLCCGKAGERAAWSEKCPEAYVCIDCKSLPARFDKLRNDANESNRLIAATAERAEAERDWYKSRADDLVRYLSMKPPQINAVEAVIVELTLRAARKERP